MPRDLLHAWFTLIALSAGSTAIAVAQASGAISGGAVAAAGVAILGLAWGKARVILNAYLGLARAPFWQRGFGIVLGLYALLLLGLYLAG